MIGNLGGVTVAIPRAFARFVEYDTDPHFTKRTFWSSPQRTFQSRLRSFGFEVRYPDMASVEVRTAEEKDIYTTMWMRVGITSGEFYGVDDSLENHKKYSLDPKFTCLSEDHCYLYVPLPDKTYGLTGYTPTGSGVDLEARNIESGRGADMRDENIYFFQNDAGQVRTYIECSNMTHAAANCTQFFNLSPAMKAHIRVSYRKALLPHWQQIQQAVTELLYSFEVNPDTFQQASKNGS